MNNNDFTLNQIKSILPSLVEGKEGLTYWDDFGRHHEDLCELSLIHEFFIDSIEQEKNLITIKFNQHEEMEGWGFTYRFITLQEKEVIEKYLFDLTYNNFLSMT